MAEYIDREEAKKAMLGEFHADIERYGCEIPECFDGDRASILLDLLPPADVRPVRRGRWAPHPDPNCKEWDVCTACGTGCKRREYGTNPDGTDYVTEWTYPYCPNCGSYNGGDADG